MKKTFKGYCTVCKKVIYAENYWWESWSYGSKDLCCSNKCRDSITREVNHQAWKD